jgi:hypothetical protein
MRKPTMGSPVVRVVVMLGASGLAITVAACGGPTAPTARAAPAAPSPTLSLVSVSGSAPAIGETSQFAATANFSDGTAQDVTNQASWLSSNTAVATVSNSGVVTGVGAGEADIGAVYQNRTGSQHITLRFTGRPQGGTWNGAVIRFNVSADGSRITTSGSAIRAATGPVALQFGPVQCGTGSFITIYAYDNVPIQSAAFSSSTSGPRGSATVS